MKIEEFENIFGNVPFNELKKINKYIDDNYIPKSKVKELREIDNIDLLQFKIKELLQEGDKQL